MITLASTLNDVMKVINQIYENKQKAEKIQSINSIKECQFSYCVLSADAACADCADF